MTKTNPITATKTFRFARFANALNFASRSPKALGIIHGDDGMFWVCTLADCSRLVRAGYEQIH